MLFKLVLAISFVCCWKLCYGDAINEGNDTDPFETAWNMFKKDLKKSYWAKHEETIRKSLFEERYSMITTHNENSNSSYTMGLNQFSDQSEDELRKQMGLRRSLVDRMAISVLFFAYRRTSINLPSLIDYRNDSCMQPIKDQGKCGNCWAFATVSLVEFNNCADTGYPIALSEQQVTDCTYLIGRNGCNGGSITEALQGIARRQFGINTQSSYPYTSGQTGKSGWCNHSPSVNGASVSLLFPVKRIPFGDTHTIMSILAERGIVAVGFNVVSSFMSYKSGVYTEPDCNTNIIGTHAITIVGYGTDPTTGLDYWICRNSWSSKWGDAGYVLFQRSINLCGIESSAIGTTIGGLSQLFLSRNIY